MRGELEKKINETNFRIVEVSNGNDDLEFQVGIKDFKNEKYRLFPTFQNLYFLENYSEFKDLIFETTIKVLDETKYAMLFLSKEPEQKNYHTTLIFYPEVDYGTSIVSHQISKYNPEHHYGLYNNGENIFYLEFDRKNKIHDLKLLNNNPKKIKTQSISQDINLGIFRNMELIKDDELCVVSKNPIIRKPTLYNLYGHKIF